MYKRVTKATDKDLKIIIIINFCFCVVVAKIVLPSVSFPSKN